MIEHPTQIPSANRPSSESPNRNRGWWIAIFIASLLGGLVGAGAMAVWSGQPNQAVITPTAAAAPQPTQPPVAIDINSAVTDAVAQVGPSVVTVINHLPPRISIFGGRLEQSSSGSGVIISNDGHIVTNNHVVEGHERLEVILADGTTLPAELVGEDPYADLAVLETQGDMPAVATWGNSDSLKPGETVIAIGSPLGAFKNTVTVGVISATDRSLDTGQTYQLEGLLQTDAAINQGNSGGPLINLAGQIVGINTVIVRGSGAGPVAEGLGFAIPSNTARAVSSQIIDQGYVSRPFLGADGVWITPEIAARYDLPVEHGLFISHVTEDGPADRAGIRRGDIIYAMNDQALDADHPFINTLFAMKPGAEVTFRLMRGEQQLEVEVILEERPVG